MFFEAMYTGITMPFWDMYFMSEHAANKGEAYDIAKKFIQGNFIFTQAIF